MATKLTGEQKAAILLLAMGEDAAALVMKHLPPGDIRKIGATMAELHTITREDETEVIQEFKRSATDAGIGAGVLGGRIAVQLHPQPSPMGWA